MQHSVLAVLGAVTLHAMAGPSGAAPAEKSAKIPNAAARLQNPRLLAMPDVAVGQSIHAAVFSPDGATIVTSGVDWGDPNKADRKRIGILQLWDAATGKLIRSFEGHVDAVQKALFSADGRRLASQSQDGMIASWEVSTGRLLRTLLSATPPVKLGPNMTPAELRSWAERPNLLGFGADGRSVVVARRELIANKDKADAVKKPFMEQTRQRLQTWDVETGQLARTTLLAGLTVAESSSTMRLSPDGRTALVPRTIREAGQAGAEAKAESKRLEIYHMADGILLRALDLGRDTGFNYVTAISADSQNATVTNFPHYKDAAARDKRTLTIWNLADGKALRTLQSQRGLFGRVAFSRDGARLAASAQAGLIEIYNVSDGRLEQTLSGGHCGDVGALDFAPDGQKLVSVGQGDSFVQIWDLTAPAIVSPPRALMENSNTRAREFDAQGQLWSVSDTVDWSTQLRKGQSLDVVRLDVQNGARETIVIPDTRLLYAAAFSRDHTLLAAALGTQPQPAHIEGAGVGVWEIATKKLLFHVPGNTFMTGALAFSPDQSTLAIGSDDNTLALWDVRAQRLLRQLPKADSSVSSALFSPDGQTLLTGSGGGSISFYDVVTGKLKRRLDDDPSVRSLSFSPDGTMLATGGTLRVDNRDALAMVRLWEVSSGRLLHEFSSPDRSFSGLSFSPDGRLLAFSSYIESKHRRTDSRLDVWDIATQTLAATLPDMCGVEAPLFVPDGRHLLAQSGGWLKMWDLQTLLKAPQPSPK